MKRWTICLLAAFSLGLTWAASFARADGPPTAGFDRSIEEPGSKDRGRKKAPDGDADDDNADASEKSDRAATDKKDDDATSKPDKAKKPDPVKKLIEVKLDQFLIPARTINIALPGRTKTLRDLLEKFEAWSKDEEVGALLLNLDGLNLAIPDIEELRAGLFQLKSSGKKIYTFLNSGDDMGYLLAAGADEIAIAPTGSLALPGLGRLFPFMRGMYQMQGIEYDVITAGRFKYPGFLTSREPNKYFVEEFEAILDSWFGDYVQFMADGRKLSKERVREAINLCLMNAQEAKSRGFVDVLAYYDEYVERVAKRTKFRKTGEEETDFSRITSLNDLLNALNKEYKKAQETLKAVGPKIAILHARGPIVDVSMGSSLFSSMMIMRDDFVKTIEDIRKNKTIQAVVLRIDSPGGSGYASDVIWHKLRELDEEKPLVVSMGTVAGSGGYYIACPARLIFAEPTTITGSIGVLGIFPNMASQINRMDVNLAEMKRGDRALLGSGHADMRPADRELIQRYILDFYEVFLDRVAVTRKMPKEEVRKLAEGRIYTGRQAKEIGLIDRLGGLKDAIAAARDFANIPASAEIKIVHYPGPASIGEALEGFLGASSGDISAMVERVQNTAPTMTFDTQLRLLTQRMQPLCWMAAPEFSLLLAPPPTDTVQRMRRELLGLPAARP